MKLVYIASLVIIVASSEYCGYGTFTDQTTNGECQFLCNGETYVDIEDLTFDMIKNNCGDVAAAAAINPDCNSLDDLVYAEFGNQFICQCPYCKCSTKDTNGETTELFKYQADEVFTTPSKECYNCTCVDWSWSGYFDQGTMINRCTQLSTTQNPDTWSDFTCPPAKCEASKSGGQFWYEDVSDSDTTCEEYCYCDGSGDEVCKTGFSNIVKNDKMVNQLRSDCAYDSTAAVRFI